MSLTKTRETTSEGVRAANALRSLRELHGLSRTQLAALTPGLNLTPQAIARIEKGQTRFPFDAVPVFAAVFDVPKAAFLAPLHPAYRASRDLIPDYGSTACA